MTADLAERLGLPRGTELIEARSRVSFPPDGSPPTQFDVLRGRQITNATFTRGSGRLDGLATMTGTVDVARQTLPQELDRFGFRFHLLPALTDLIAARSGVIWARELNPRFVGRMVGTDWKDTGDGKEMTSQISLSDWLSMLTTLPEPAKWGISAPATVATIMNSFKVANEFDILNIVQHPQTATGNPLTRFVGTSAGTPMNEFIDSYLSAPGTLLVSMRENQRLMPFSAFRQAAQRWQVTGLQVPRAFVLSPVSYTQPVVSRESVVWRQRETDAGNSGAVSVFWNPPPPTEFKRWPVAEEVDLFHVAVTNYGSLNVKSLMAELMRARYYRAVNDRPSVQSMTIDAAALLQAGGQPGARFLQKLLALEVGDPLALADDWPTIARGVHFVSQIRETWTRTGWRFDLDLIQAREVVGTDAAATLDAPTWDTSRARWDATTNTWNG